MKKILAVALAAALCLTFCACGSILKDLKDNAEKAAAAETAAPKETGTEIKETAAQKTEKSGVRTKPAGTETASADTEKPAKQSVGKNTDADTGKSPVQPTKKNKADEAAMHGQTVQTTKAPSKMTAENITPVISAAKYAYAPVRVTKSPASEAVYEGGSASFIAYAENSTGISWLIVNPNGRDFVEASALARSMPGLSISGTASDTLTIGCIPASFDGWYIQAKFDGEGGPVHSAMARLTVWPYPTKSSAWDVWNCPGIYDPWSCGRYDLQVQGGYPW